MLRARFTRLILSTAAAAALACAGGAGTASATFCPPILTPPPATFTAAPTTVPAGGTVAFNASSDGGSLQLQGDPTDIGSCILQGPPTPITVGSYAWDFGDGTTGTGQAPMHQYLTPGIYTVKLTATAATTGSGSTTQNITATGYLPLTISRNGSGAGTVTSVPAGIDCGAMCANLYLVATPIALTATPAAGSAFTGWSGACSGTGGCAVAMNHARSVTATFDALPAPVVNQPQTQPQTQPQGATHPAGKCAALKGHKRSACITKKCGRLKPHSTKKRRKAYGRCRSAAVRKAS